VSGAGEVEGARVVDGTSAAHRLTSSKRGRLVSTSHPREKLESLFLRVVGGEGKSEEKKG